MTNFDKQDAFPQQTLCSMMMDASTDLMFFKDAQGIYKYCNQAAAEFLGLSREAVLGKSDFGLFAEAVAFKIQGDEHTVMLSRETQTFERWYIRHDGAQRADVGANNPTLCRRWGLCWTHCDEARHHRTAIGRRYHDTTQSSHACYP